MKQYDYEILESGVKELKRKLFLSNLAWKTISILLVNGDSYVVYHVPCLEDKENENG